MTDLPELPGLDSQRGLRQCGGRLSLYQSLLRLYARQNAGFGAQVRGALDRGDRAGAERLAHTLKGSSAQVGATEVERHAAALEECLRSPAGADQALERLAGLEAALADLLARLAPRLPAE